MATGLPGVSLKTLGAQCCVALRSQTRRPDCPDKLCQRSATQHCADILAARIAPVHYKQLGLGTVLARAQACDGVGPAVELPGLRHVVDADDEGQATREECVSQLRVKDQVVP